MSEYRLSLGVEVVRLADGAIIPDGEGNPDRQRYQAWLDAGNTPGPVDPEDLVSAKISAIEVLYAAKSLHGFAHGGKRFELDDGSQQKIAALATSSGFFLLGVGDVTWAPLPFVAADNSVRVFATPADFIVFANAAKLAAQALFARRYALKTLCRGAVSAEEVEAIDIATGWPEV